MNPSRLLALLALTLTGVFAATAVTEAASKKRGVQRRYAGAAWAPPASRPGFYAKLQLNSAAARDSTRGGYIAQTFWVATNEGRVAYGKNVKAPYVQASLSRGYRKHGGNYMVVAERDAKGRYFEGRVPGPKVNFGQSYAFSILVRDVSGDQWKVHLGPDVIATADSMGSKFGSLSVYAGLESTSSRNYAKGKVSDLARLEVNSSGAVPFPGWNLGGDQYHARLVHRGPGGAKWEARDQVLVNSLGQP